MLSDLVNHMKFDLGGYLSKLKLPPENDLEPTVETLFLVVNRHVVWIPYQNLLFYNAEKKERPHDLSIQAVEKQLFKEENGGQYQGGMCYESSELLYYALASLGFYVNRVHASSLNNQPF